MASLSSFTAPLSPGNERLEEIADRNDRGEIAGDLNSHARANRTGFAVRSHWGKILLWLTGTSTAGYAISALLHGLLLAGLSIVIIPSVSGFGEINTLIGISDTEQAVVEGFDQLELETRIDLEGGHRSSEHFLTQAEPTLYGIEEIVDGISSSSDINLLISMKDGKGEGEKEGDGSKGGAGGFAMPSSGKVFTKGSFTAWTIPEDPKPNENYLIVIQVKLPPKYKSIPIDDVTGLVQGTDGYRLRINAYTSKFLQKTKQIVLRIPGAESKIRDTIQVRSQILKEEQELTIEF